MGLQDRDYMMDTQTVSKQTRGSSIRFGTWFARLMHVIIGLILLISSLNFMSALQNPASICQVEKIQLDANGDGRFTYRDIGELTMVVFSRPVVIATTDHRLAPVADFLELKKRDCVSPRSSPFNGISWLIAATLLTTILKTGLHFTRVVLRSFCFKFMKINPFGVAGKFIYRNTNPVVHFFGGTLIHISFFCGLTAVAVLAQLDRPTERKSPANLQPSDGATTVSDLGQTLIAARVRGCGTKLDSSPTMTVEPRLNEAAMALAQGLTLQQSLKMVRYRASDSFSIGMKGYATSTAVQKEVVTKHCEQLTKPEFSHLGFHRIGKTYWIIFAAPFAPPKLDQAVHVDARVLELVNQARSQSRYCGDEFVQAAGPLVRNDLLNAAARQHAEDMATHSFMSHRGKDGSTPRVRMQRIGYRSRSSGENVAAGHMTADAVVAGWLKSPGHCANIMRPNFTEMGVGFAKNIKSEYGVYWAQLFGGPN